MRTLLDARTAIHAALTGVMAWLAVVLALPANTFGTSVAYRHMADLAGEGAWAMAFWFVASSGFIGLFTGSLRVRMASVLALATMHGVVAGLFLTSNPAGFGAGTFVVLALLGYYLAWRRSIEGI